MELYVINGSRSEGMSEVGWVDGQWVDRQWVVV